MLVKPMVTKSMKIRWQSAVGAEFKKVYYGSALLPPEKEKKPTGLSIT